MERLFHAASQSYTRNKTCWCCWWYWWVLLFFLSTLSSCLFWMFDHHNSIVKHVISVYWITSKRVNKNFHLYQSLSSSSTRQQAIWECLTKHKTRMKKTILNKIDLVSMKVILLHGLFLLWNPPHSISHVDLINEVLLQWSISIHRCLKWAKHATQTSLLIQEQTSIHLFHCLIFFCCCCCSRSIN